MLCLNLNSRMERERETQTKVVTRKLCQSWKVYCIRTQFVLWWMMQIFSRPFTIGNAVCHSSKVDKQLKTCNWVFAIYSFMWAAECRIILSEDIRWLLPTILRKSNFWQNFTNCPLYLYQIFLSTCRFIFFTSCQFRLSRQQSRCQKYTFPMIQLVVG